MEFYFAYFTIRPTTDSDFPFIRQYYLVFSSFYALTNVTFVSDRIFAFHPAVTHLQGLEVTSPWKETNPMYPAPHHELLRAHYQTSIFASLSAAAKPLDDDDDDNDHNKDLPDIPSDHNEAVGI